MGKDAPNAPGVFRLFLRMGGWAVLILAGLLLLFSFIGQAVLTTAERFETEGRVAEAQVLEKYIRESRDSDGDRKLTYYFKLRFETQAGDQVTLDESVGRTKYHEIDLGGRFEILYLESEPRKVEVTPGSNRTGARVLQSVSLGFGLICLGLLWWIGTLAVGGVRARRYGRAEEVAITEVKRTNVRVNNRARYRIIWHDSEGRRGKSLLAKHDQVSDYKAGDKILVYHGIKHMWWEGDVGQRLAE